MRLLPLVCFIVLAVVVVPALDSPLDLIVLALAAVALGIALGARSRAPSGRP